MFGIPDKELKEAAQLAVKRLAELEPTIRRIDLVLTQHEDAMNNIVGITADLKAITGRLRAAIVVEEQ